MTDTETTPKIFLTDYGSYNEGSQFEFGHWVELSQFDSVEDYAEYEKKHFENADKKSPLFGGIREETMITDFEGFPRAFYSESSMDFERLFEWLEMDENEKESLEVAMQYFSTIEEAFEKREDLHFYQGEAWEIFDQFYPEVEEITNKNPYLKVDYDQFLKEGFTPYTTEAGNTYYIAD